jgi:hypothetical protein
MEKENNEILNQGATAREANEFPSPSTTNNKIFFLNRIVKIFIVLY